MYFSILFHELISWALPVKLVWGEYLRTQLMIRQQSITWANVHPDICHHMASLSHNELTGRHVSFTIHGNWWTAVYFRTLVCLFHSLACLVSHEWINSLRLRQIDDILQTTFSNVFSITWRCVLISIKISLKFIPKDAINNIPALVQLMAWGWQGDKPLSEPMMIILLTHICVTRPEWVKKVVGDKQVPSVLCFINAGLILCLCPANEKRYYFVTASLIAWVQA